MRVGRICAPRIGSVDGIFKEEKMGISKFPDKEMALEGLEHFKNDYNGRMEPVSDCCPTTDYKREYENLREEYLGFSQFIQSLFISKYGYIIDTGNFETVNYELMHCIAEKIRKHPHLWKIFFQVA